MLASLLKGAGYDAYVVSGYASKKVTTVDESDIVYDLSQHESPEERWKTAVQEQGTRKDPRYRVKPPRHLKSNFTTKMLAKQSELEAAAAQKKPTNQQKANDALKSTVSFASTIYS